MTIAKRYRRMNKALRLAESTEAEAVLAAAKEILSTRIKHGDAVNSPRAVQDYLRLLLHDRQHEVFVVVLVDAQHRVISVEELFQEGALCCVVSRLPGFRLPYEIGYRNPQDLGELEV